MSKPVKLQEGRYFGNSVDVMQNEYLHYSLTSYSPGMQIENHYHEQGYLSLLVQGTYKEISHRDTLTIQPGAIIFRPAGCCHSNEFGMNGGTCFNIEIKRKWQQNYISGNALPSAISVYKPGSIPSLSKLLVHFAMHSDLELCSELLLDGLLEISEIKIKKKSLPWISKVKDILENEISEHHTLNALAKRVFVHPIYLSRAFKIKTGYTIAEYQLKMKLNKAFTLLVNSNIPVNEIAFNSGFFDTPHFCRSFKLFYQVTPTQLRRALKS